MPGGPDTFIELALEYRNKGIPANFSFLYDEWKRRYVPPHLDPRSDQFVVPPRPKPVYRSIYFDPFSGSFPVRIGDLCPVNLPVLSVVRRGQERTVATGELVFSRIGVRGSFRPL